ncbi:hypothetical protein RirG_204810 [Rhizophagus irregularis DAOM 197198w]|nr:hypothetical protein RirG_204810 [Rhizophagus irregularis DAOM 197198w]
MERTLREFIPLVRFHYMSPEDFLDKIFPLKGLLPRDLLNDLLTFHITLSRRTNVNIPPPRQLKIDSAIIQPKHIAIFAAAAFHAKCDNKGATIVVVKIQNLEQIVGGYNPLTGGWSTAKDSFIFSFTDRNNLQTAKVGYINDGYYGDAIYSDTSLSAPSLGP